ncbi:MAG: pyridoxamine 5'-phosphate oxidase family protein [bacterium]
MTKQEIIEFINTNQVCNLATVEGNQPRVRGMMTYQADETGIIFHTGNKKDLYQQLLKNPLVELCYFNPKTNMQIRVTGKAMIIDDLKLKQEIVEARPFMKPWVDQFGYELLIVFKVVDCIAQIWTFETNLALKEYIKLNS